MGTADRCRGQRETAWAGGQAVASAAVTAAQRSWKRHRRSANETRSSLQITGRKYWCCSANAAQQRAADTKLSKAAHGVVPLLDGAVVLRDALVLVPARAMGHPVTGVAPLQ